MKITKLQGLQAFFCHHPIPRGTPYDDLGRARCPRCGWKITIVLTRKGFDRQLENTRRLEGW